MIETRVRRVRGSRRGSLSRPTPSFSCFLGSYDHENSVVGFVLEFNVARREGKEGMVFTHADIDARMHFRAALAHDDVARNDVLATELLDAKTTTGRVAAVAG